MRRAVFVDKDGTLVEDVPYNVDPARLRFTPDALHGLRLLHEHGHAIVIVTNQPGIAMGLFDLAALDRLKTAIESHLMAAGVPLAGFHACPHSPGQDGLPACRCRKPEPGLLLDAAAELQIDLTESWMIGDILNDVEAGRRAGCRTILMDVGNETEWQLSPMRTPSHRASTLLHAARIIVGHHTAAESVVRGPSETPAICGTLQ